MAQLYADENFPRTVVVELRKLGYDVLTAQDAGQANQKIPDEAVLKYAIALRRAVLTHNRWHFVKLHARVSPHCGIIVCTRDDDVLALAARVHQALAAHADLTSRLVRVNKPSIP